MPMPAQYSTDSHRYDCFITPRLTEIWKQYVVFYLKKNRMAQHHPPFDKKKMWRHVLPMCPFSFLQMIRKIVWSKGDNSSELSNFDTIVKI
jgi:hypothetical protein